MKNYSEHFGRPPDFRVHYHRLDPEGQRRPFKFFQHMRSDFTYSEFDVQAGVDNYFMIHPEFEQEDGAILPEDKTVPYEGSAGMWIVINEMRDFHRKRIEIGVKGFMMDGPYRIAEVEVIEVVSL